MGTGDQNFEDELKAGRQADTSQTKKFTDMVKGMDVRVQRAETTQTGPTEAEKYAEMRKQMGWADRAEDSKPKGPRGVGG
jgi:hypothetical protein